MGLSIIVAMAKNRVIGNHNQLLWRLPQDWQHFKQTTLNKTIVMGRKTWQSLPIKPLPQRHNIILSSQSLELRDYQGADRVTQIHAIEDILHLSETQQTEVIIIGGAKVYQQTLPSCQRLYLTLVHAELDGDAYFPDFNCNQWQVIKQQDYPADNRHQYAFSIQTLMRKSA